MQHLIRRGGPCFSRAISCAHPFSSVNSNINNGNIPIFVGKTGVLQAFAGASVVQFGLCGGSGAMLLTKVAELDQSPMLTKGTAAFLLGFGSLSVLGIRSFVKKHVVKLELSPDRSSIYVTQMGYPFGSDTREFDVEEVRSAVAGHTRIDVVAESKSNAPIIPLMVSGEILLMDLRGELTDVESLNALLNADYDD